MDPETLSIKDLTEQAGQAEKDKDTDAAISLYNHILKVDKLNTNAFDRLMKLYRELKDYKKELVIINKGIKEYEKFYNSHSKRPSKKVSELSAKLNRSFGLIDKKGKSAYMPQPLARWTRRKETVSKKIKS